MTAVASAATPSGSGASGGSSSHSNCAASGYAALLSTIRQLSIAPVGHGGTHAMHCLQIAGSTT